MEMTRDVVKYWKSKSTMEGAGVRLKRAFGFYEVPLLDPFLLLDDFHSENPDDYIAGFPWHPHRGIETVTYMLSGEVEHSDSMGNSGAIGAGDTQWMTAGSGIIHQEMPKRQDGLLSGFQLWVNLPAESKMMSPRYRDIRNDKVPLVEVEDGVNIKVICGRVNGIEGPVKNIIADPEYLDISMAGQTIFKREIKKGYKVFTYVIRGSAYFDEKKDVELSNETLVVYGDGEDIEIEATGEGVRYLLISGKPIGEPIAWRGPIVMNTDEELEVAFDEYFKGTFIKETGK